MKRLGRQGVLRGKMVKATIRDAKAINGLHKAELIHLRALRKTRKSVEMATMEWVSWFNTQRLLGPIGYTPPAEAEANHYRRPATPVAMAA